MKLYLHTCLYGFERFEGKIQPTKQATDNDPSSEQMSHNECDFTKRVLAKFDCKNLWDLSSLYLKAGVFTLANVFMKSIIFLSLYQCLLKS